MACLAAADGDSLSGKELQSLKQAMTIRQIDIASARVSAWKTNHQVLETVASTEERAIDTHP